ncbi:MAG: hypothetical protein EA425_04920 [Puniceicoccaceae bacterium]|nr:MAG: hypothetical protein EA425_04920 [Puniceicoccaceae bacterium]
MTARPRSESPRTVPLSGRVAEEDFTFLMSHPVDGMVTASEKLRHVCAFYRRHHENRRHYADCLHELELWLAPVRRALREAERTENLHSEIIEILLAGVPRLMAVLVSAHESVKEGEGRKALLQLEKTALDRTLELLETILRLGVTRQAPAYNPEVLHGRLTNILELLEIVRAKS